VSSIPMEFHQFTIPTCVMNVLISYLFWITPVSTQRKIKKKGGSDTPN